MGVLLKPTPDMGDWIVEVFTDRACLRRTAPADSAATGVHDARRDPARDEVTLPELDDAASSDRGFGFEITDLEPVIATLDQVLADRCTSTTSAG